MNKKIKNIRVFNTKGKELAPTNIIIARTLVGREKAKWIEKEKSLTLIYTKVDFRELKKKVIIEEKRKCYICGDIIDKDTPATIDHVNPKSKQGKDNRDNLRCCCKRCNDDKRDRTFSQYYYHIMNNINKYSYIDFKNLNKEKSKYIRKVC